MMMMKLVFGEQENITKSECPRCHRMFCVQCHSPWHEGMECEEVQEQVEGDREREDLLLKEVAESSLSGRGALMASSLWKEMKAVITSYAGLGFLFSLEQKKLVQY